MDEIQIATSGPGDNIVARLHCRDCQRFDGTTRICRFHGRHPQAICSAFLPRESATAAAANDRVHPKPAVESERPDPAP